MNIKLIKNVNDTPNESAIVIGVFTDKKVGDISKILDDPTNVKLALDTVKRIKRGIRILQLF